MSKTLLFSITLFGLASCTASSYALGNASIDDKLGGAAQYIVGRSKLLLPSTYSLIYVTLREKQAADNAKRHNLDNADTLKALTEAEADSISYANSVSFSNLCYANRQKIISDSVRNRAGPTQISLSPTDLEIFLEREIDTLTIPDGFPRGLTEQDQSLTEQEMMTTVLWIYSVASTPRDVLQPYFASAIQKFHAVSTVDNPVFDLTGC